MILRSPIPKIKLFVTLLILIISVNNSFSQSKKELRKELKQTLLEIEEIFNQLPMATGGQYDSKYVFSFDCKSKFITIKEKLYKKGKTNRAEYYNYISVYLPYLDPNFISVINDDSLKRCSIQLIATNNNNTIANKVYEYSGPSVTLYKDRMIFGYWKSRSNLEKLNRLEELFYKAIINSLGGTPRENTYTSTDIITKGKVAINNGEVIAFEIPELDTTYIHVYKMIENMPLFNNAKDQKESNRNVQEYINKRIKDEGITMKGKVYLYFEIDEKGNTINVELNPTSDSYNKPKKKLVRLAIKYIEEMPKWKPGEENGEIVRVGYTLPIVFK